MDIKLVLLILGILLFVWTKFKTSWFKTKDAVLIKEDEALQSEVNKVKTELEKLKVQVPTQPMTPEQVEHYWNTDEKKS